MLMLCKLSTFNWQRPSSFLDVSLACEDGNSKLVDIVTVANVDAEDHVGNSL